MMTALDIDFVVPDRDQAETLKSFIADLIQQDNRTVTRTSSGVVVMSAQPRLERNLLIFRGGVSSGKSSVAKAIKEMLGRDALIGCRKIEEKELCSRLVVMEDDGAALHALQDSTKKLTIDLLDPTPHRYAKRKLIRSATNVIYMTDRSVVDPELAAIGAVIEFPHRFPERMVECRERIVAGLARCNRLPMVLSRIVGEFYHKELPPAVVSKENEVKETPVIIHARRNQWGNYMTDDGLVINRPSEQVIGRQDPDGTVIALSREDEASCRAIGLRIARPIAAQTD